MSTWKILGLCLLVWAFIDIAMGRTFLHRSISRTQEPTFFWTVAAAWVSIATILLVYYE
jgi:hypothetical protein